MLLTHDFPTTKCESNIVLLTHDFPTTKCESNIMLLTYAFPTKNVKVTSCKRFPSFLIPYRKQILFSRAKRLCWILCSFVRSFVRSTYIAVKLQKVPRRLAGYTPHGYKYDEETRRELNVSEPFMAVDRCVRIKVGRSKKWWKAHS